MTNTEMKVLLEDVLRCLKASTDYEMSAREASLFRCSVRKRIRRAIEELSQ